MTIVLSGMLAVALDDFTISIFDMEMKRVVRHFSGQRGQINDMVRDFFFPERSWYFCTRRVGKCIFFCTNRNHFPRFFLRYLYRLLARMEGG